MGSRSTGARRVRAIVAACLLTALVVASTAMTGCGLLGGETSKSTSSTPPKTPAESTRTADATGTAASEGSGGEADATDTTADSAPATPLPADDAAADELIRDDARLICVDTKSEFKQEHVKGATSVPMKDFDESAKKWNASKPVLVTSRTEARALSAASYLTRQGFSDVHYLIDGHDGWNGKFEGTNAPVRTIPSEVYFIYSSKPVPFLGDPSGITWQDVEGVTENMEAIKKEFGDVSFTFVDVYENNSDAVDLVDRFDIPLLGRTLLIPHWVLVDPDGNYTHLNTVPATTQTPRVFGFVYKQQEIAETR